MATLNSDNLNITRAAIAEQVELWQDTCCPEPSCLNGERMYLGANGHYFAACHEPWHNWHPIETPTHETGDDT